MGTYTEFIDVTGSNFGRSPLVRGTVRAIYVTGSGGILESAAEIAAAKAAGVGLIRIDQSPGLALFAAGHADVGDIEYLAGTDQSAEIAVGKRQALGLKEHGLYASFSAIPALKASIRNPAGVGYWVADYSWSILQAELRLAANADWNAVQFGDPNSNPTTLVPGTNVSLRMAQADIDVAKTSWLSQFLGTPAPPPPPVTAPQWPFSVVDYLGMQSTDPACHSGYTSTVDNHVVRTWQQRMIDRGWNIGRVADGFYDLRTKNVCLAFQREKGLGVDGLCGPHTWAAAWTAPITP